MSKRIFITGIGGFVGKNLSAYLSKKGDEVFGLMRGNTGFSFDPEVRIIQGDILDKEAIHTIIRDIKPDIIYHFAALSRVGHSFQTPDKTLETNILGTLSLLEAVRVNAPHSRVIFASSGEIYGSSPQPVSGCSDSYIATPFAEDKVINPTTSPYSISKICGEYLMQCYAQAFGVDAVIARSFNVEGSGRGDGFVTSVICSQVVSLWNDGTRSITLGNLAIFRDFTHISDAVRAYEIMSLNGISGSVYNIGSMKMTSLATFLLYALQVCGYEVRTVQFGDTVSIPDPLSEILIWNNPLGKMTALDAYLVKHPDIIYPDSHITLKTNHGDIVVRIDKDRFRPAENWVMAADTRLIHELGYTPEYSLQQLVYEQVQYYLKKGNQ